MWSLSFYFLNIIIIVAVRAHLQLDPQAHNNAFDLNLYQDVLDPEECAKQLTYISNNTALIMEFLDAGARIPRGIFSGNFRDMGNYFQCLGIQRQVQDSSIEGKYCVVEIPLNQDELEFPSLPTWPDIPQIPWPNMIDNINDDSVIKKSMAINRLKSNMGMNVEDNFVGTSSRAAEGSPIALDSFQFEFAICLPKVCSVKNLFENIVSNTSGFKFKENFCRLPNDKPWVAADTVAVVIFSFIGLLIVLSTSYDLYHHVIKERDPKQTNTLCTTFSVFTNSRKLFTFHPNPNAITCIDGVRSMSMLWVLVGHTFLLQMGLVSVNQMDLLDYIQAFSSIWIMSANVAVDTFFLLSGLLLVYTTVSKFSKMSLIKNLHLFYLNRLLRMFPVLATVVLMQASFQNRVTDGPHWHLNAYNTNKCRQFWWTTLLYVQNLVNPHTMCLDHSWYLAIDMQLYIVSPIVLFWVFRGNKRFAWTALIGSFLAVWAASTVYVLLNDFASGMIVSPEEQDRRHADFYVHPLPRAAPFFIGMVLGYALHLVKGQSIRLSKLLVAFLWIIAGSLTTSYIYIIYNSNQMDWDNPLVDNILGTIMTPAWCVGVAWLIFACAKGYGGPINWFLSLHIFKILGRLSYAMYLVHYPLMFIVNGTAFAPIYFSVERSMHQFFVDLGLTLIASYIVTVAIDLPMSGLIGMILGGKKFEKQRDPKKDDELQAKDSEAPAVDGLEEPNHREPRYKSSVN